MKKTLSIIYCLLPLSSFAQDKVVYFYDGSGNVISRLLTLETKQTRAMVSSDSLFVQRMESGNIKIYPNPTASIVTIEGINENGEETVYQLYNISSKLLEVQISRSSSVQFDLSMYPSGVYLLRIADRKDIPSFKIIRK